MKKENISSTIIDDNSSLHSYLDYYSFNYDSSFDISLEVFENLNKRKSVILNIGTTTEKVAESLLSHQGLKVVTNNINIVNIFAHSNDTNVWLAGGKVRKSDSAVIGESTADFIKQFKVDYAVIGVSAIDNDGLLMDFDHREVMVSKAIFKCSRKLILVADDIKFERTAPMVIGNITEIDILVTNNKPSPELIDICNSNNIEIVIAKEQTSLEL